MNLPRIVVLFIVLAGFVFANSCESQAQMPPSDSGKRQLIVVGPDNAPPLAWFSTQPILEQLKNSVQFTHFLPTSKLFNERYRSTLGTNFPIVAYLRPDGGVIYAADAQSMPTTAEGLLTELAQAHKQAVQARKATQPPAIESSSSSQDCPDGICPLPQEGAIFPKLKPFLQPTANPLDGVVSGIYDRAVRNGVTILFIVLGLGAFLVFGGLIFVSVIYLLGKWISK